MRKPEGILFDMGGVLLDPADQWDAAGFDVSFPEGLPEPAPVDWFLKMSADIIETFLVLPPPRPAMDPRPFIATWLWKRGLAPTDEAIELWYDVLSRWEARPVYGFAPSALRTLHGMGVRMGLVSNTLMPGTYIRERFREAGVHDLFDVLVFSAEFGANKPDPAIFRHALASMALEPHQAWYVGDKPQRDICGAHGVGMTAVLVDSKHAEHIHAAPENVPDLRVANISALPDILKRL